MLIQAFRARIQQYRARKFLRNSRYRPQLRTLPTGLLQYLDRYRAPRISRHSARPAFFLAGSRRLTAIFCLRTPQPARLRPAFTRS
jgi:hypothetical protein